MKEPPPAHHWVVHPYERSTKVKRKYLLIETSTAIQHSGDIQVPDTVSSNSSVWYFTTDWEKKPGSLLRICKATDPKSRNLPGFTKQPKNSPFHRGNYFQFLQRILLVFSSKSLKALCQEINTAQLFYLRHHLLTFHSNEEDLILCVIVPPWPLTYYSPFQHHSLGWTDNLVRFIYLFIFGHATQFVGS